MITLPCALESVVGGSVYRRLNSLSFGIFATMALLANVSVAQGNSPGWSLGELTDHMSDRAFARVVDRYGEATEDALIVEEARKRFIRGQMHQSDRLIVDASIQRILSISAQGLGPFESAKLSRAMKKVAEFALRLDGPTDEVLDYLEIAFALDPSNEDLGSLLSNERERKSIAAARVAEAARVREARASGEDPYTNMPYIGGPTQSPEAPTSR